MESLKKGDLVRLKSGGPRMTVVQVYEDDVDVVRCEWFGLMMAGEGYLAVLPPSTVETHDFPCACLIPWRPSS